jgi:hypothetical protein
MLAILLIAALAIDSAIWFVHGRHLQTEADAAALAGAQLFQFPCTSGASTPGTTDYGIQQLVNQYDGTTAPPAGTFYNQQVNVEPTPATLYSPTSHNLFSLLNYPQFENQTLPNPGDSLTKSPCSDSAIDVKMTETNLPSFFPFVHPGYIDKEAEVAIENLTSLGSGVSPLAEPLPTPAAMTAYLVDEGNGNAVLGTVPLNPVAGTSDATWTATTPFTFNATGPVGIEIATSSSSTITSCATAANCYDTTDTPNIGVTYTHLWTSGSPNYPNIAPVLRDATVAPTTSGGCPGAPSTAFSNFISTSTSCTVTLSANLQFGTGTGATCANAGTFTVSYGTGKNPPTATLSNPNCTTGSASPNGTWISTPITVGSSVGAIPLALAWSSTSLSPVPSWATGGGSNGCGNGNNQCTYSFGTVQRIFAGGYNDESIANSNSGPILSASLTDPTGAAIQSIQNSTTPTNVTITVTVESFQNSTSISSPPIELAFGGNQQNALVSCPGQSSGKPQSELAIWQGCQNGIALDTNISATPCTPLQDATGNYLCLPAVSGNGKLDAVLDPAMQCKINGSSSTTQCNPVAGCVNPNYWASGNTLDELKGEVPADPRLLLLFTTDNNALGNGRSQVPIRVITAFYVTGWQGDPCIGKTPGSNQVHLKDGTTATMNYTGDDSPNPTDPDPSGVLLGHFVEYTVLGGGSGTGKCVQTNSLGACIGILTK